MINEKELNDLRLEQRNLAKLIFLCEAYLKRKNKVSIAWKSLLLNVEKLPELKSKNEQLKKILIKAGVKFVMEPKIQNK